MFEKECESLNRPAWTSETKTGNWNSADHKHVPRKDGTGIVKNYYLKTKGDR